MGMNTESIIFIVIIIGCILFIGICAIRRRPDIIINFGLRACLGTLGIYLVDQLLKSRSLDYCVGINAATILTNGFLGLPGFLLLYGLAVYYAMAG